MKDDFSFIVIARVEVRMVVDMSQMGVMQQDFNVSGIKLAIPGVEITESYPQTGRYEVKIVLDNDPSAWQRQIDAVTGKINTIAESITPI